MFLHPNYHLKVQQKRFNSVWGCDVRSHVGFIVGEFQIAPDFGRLVLALAERGRRSNLGRKPQTLLLCGRSNYSVLREIRLDISQTVIVKCLRGSSRKTQQR